MPNFPIMALAAFATLLLGAPSGALADAAAPPLVGEETHRAQSDFAAGGVRTLSNNWYACLDRARASEDANAAERCIVYGYGALRLSESGAAATPWMRHLTDDLVAPGQNEMLDIMGIPAAPRAAWLERYRRWVSAGLTPDGGASDPIVRDAGPASAAPASAAPASAAPASVTPAAFAPVVSDGGGHEARTDLARAADGKYPRELLRDRDIADALRRVAGAAVFAHLRDFGFGSPMEFNGRFTVGTACEPRACGISEARFVFAPDDVWLGIIDSGRMRIFGNPPRHVRALLLRDRYEAAWTGPVDDMGRQPAAQIVPVAVNASPNGQTPRLTIAPHVLPVSADPLPQIVSDGASEIRLRRYRGTMVVPVLINNTLTVPFTIDSGASDVSVSADVLQKLLDSGTMSRADFLGKQVYNLADGSKVSSETFRIHTLRVGDREVHEVMGSVTNDADGLLLGQSFLTRFRSWSIDNQRQVLVLK